MTKRVFTWVRSISETNGQLSPPGAVQLGKYFGRPKSLTTFINSHLERTYVLKDLDRHTELRCYQHTPKRRKAGVALISHLCLPKVSRQRTAKLDLLVP